MCAPGVCASTARAPPAKEVDLKAKHSSLEANRKATQGKLSSLEAAIKAKVSANKTLEGKLSSLEAAIKAKVSANKTLEGKLSSLEAAIKAKVSANKTLEGKLSSLEADLKAKQGNLSSLEADLEAKQGNLSSLEAAIKAKQGNLSSLEAAIKAKVSANTTLEGTLSSLEADLKAKQGTLSSLEADLKATALAKATKKDASKLRKRCDKLQKANKLLEDDIACLKASSKDLIEKNADLEAKGSTMKEKFSDCLRQNQVLRRQNQVLRSKYNKTKGLVNGRDVCKEFVRLEKEYKQLQGLYKCVCEELKKETAAGKKFQECLYCDKDLLAKGLNVLHIKELGKAQQKLVERENQITERNEQIRKLSRQVKDLTQKLCCTAQNVAKRHEEGERKYEDAQKELAKREKQIEGLTRKVSITKRNLVGAKTELKSLKERLDNLYFSAKRVLIEIHRKEQHLGDDPVTISFRRHKELVFMESRCESGTSPLYGLNSVAHWRSFQLGFMLSSVGYHVLSKKKQLVLREKAKARGILCEMLLQAALGPSRTGEWDTGEDPPLKHIAPCPIDQTLAMTLSDTDRNKIMTYAAATGAYVMLFAKAKDPRQLGGFVKEFLASVPPGEPAALRRFEKKYGQPQKRYWTGF